jgi:hypothetical protein
MAVTIASSTASMRIRQAERRFGRGRRARSHRHYVAAFGAFRDDLAL